MTDEKKPPQWVALASGLRWAVAHTPDGPVTLTVYESGEASAIVLSAAEAAYLAMTLLSDGGGDFDLAAATRRLASLALTRQIESHHFDDLLPGELAEGGDDIGDAGGVLDRVGEGG